MKREKVDFVLLEAESKRCVVAPLRDRLCGTFASLRETIKPMKHLSWHKISDHINELPFASNNIAVVEANRKKICIGKYNNELFAFSFKCPHAGGLLADGYIDALGNVVCPLHRYKYSMQNGRNVSGEGYYLKHWPVEIREDGIYVEMETGWSLF